MYNDYNVTYESNINEFLIPILIGIGILIIMLVISLIAMMRVFKKSNRSGIAAIIPIYNMMVMLEIVNKPSWQIILFFIPIANLFIYFDVLFKIAKSFRKSNSFAVCTVFLPFIFLPILAFSDSEYIGINKEAMTGASIAVDLPVITNEEKESTPVVEKKETPALDISIGGGIYQKDYEASLLQIPEEERKIETIPLSNSEVIQEAPVKQEETGIDLLNNIDFIDTTPNTESQTAESVSANQVDLSVAAPSPEIVEKTVEIPVENKPAVEKKRIKLSSNMKEEDYTNCPHCGAVVKKDAGKCFMCGKELSN